MRGNGLNCELARGRGCGAHAHVHNRTSSPLQGGCAPALFRGVEGAAAPPGVPGWGEEWGIELEHPSPGGGHPRGSGRPEAAQTQTARLLLRVVPAPGVTAAGPGPPGQTWAPAGTWAPPQDWESLGHCGESCGRVGESCGCSNFSHSELIALCP